MKPSDILRLAVGSLGANKLRSFLTLLGIAIGVFSIVGVMTALSAIRQSIDSGLNILGSTTMIVTKYPFSFTGHQDRKHRPNFTVRQAKRFEELMVGEAKAVCLRMSKYGKKVRFEDRETAPKYNVFGTTEGFLDSNNYELEYGRNISDDDVLLARPVVVISKAAERKLFPNQSPLGEWVTVDKQRYQVIGVLKERGKLFGDDMDNLVLIPFDRWIVDYGISSSRSVRIFITAESHDVFEETRETAIGAMRLARGLKPEEENNFHLITNDSLLEAFGKIARAVGTAGFIISIVSLVVAGVGIMNIMLVSVTERTREIGVRKSVGARQNDILKQFLLEAVFLSEIGGFMGIAIGILAGNIIAGLMNVSMVFPWFWALVALLICSFIGISFGLYPAWKAARLHPVEALRFE